MAVLRATFKRLANKFVTDTFADFNKTFVFQTKTRTPDGQGGFTVAWTDFATVTGFVKKMSGGKMVDNTMGSTKIDDNEIFNFAFQYIEGITDDLRISYEGEVYNIQAVKAIQDVDVWLMVDAEKGEPT
jgi:SPP1 family predicted phage head-tail adaptor